MNRHEPVKIFVSCRLESGAAFPLTMKGYAYDCGSAYWDILPFALGLSSDAPTGFKLGKFVKRNRDDWDRYLKTFNVSLSDINGRLYVVR